MYLAKVQAEAMERELEEALKQPEELEEKKKTKAKAQQESLAMWAIQDPGKWNVWSEAEQQKQLKEAQIEATSHHQPQPDPEQLKLLCNLYVEQSKQLEAKRQQR